MNTPHTPNPFEIVGRGPQQQQPGYPRFLEDHLMHYLQPAPADPRAPIVFDRVTPAHLAPQPADGAFSVGYTLPPRVDRYGRQLPAADVSVMRAESPRGLGSAFRDVLGTATQASAEFKETPEYKAYHSKTTVAASIGGSVLLLASAGGYIDGFHRLGQATTWNERFVVGGELALSTVSLIGALISQRFINKRYHAKEARKNEILDEHVPALADRIFG